VVSGNKVFISSGYGRGCALFNMATGLSKIYENRNMCNHFNSCVLHNGFLYGISGQAGGEGRLVCMHFESGRVTWNQGGTGTGSLMLAGDTLVILSERGELILAKADPKKFTLLCSARVLGNRCWTMPTVRDSKIYCRDEKGNMVCIDASG
jgi:hypothetical protein